MSWFVELLHKDRDLVITLIVCTVVGFIYILKKAQKKADRRRAGKAAATAAALDPLAPSPEEPATLALTLETTGEPLHINNPFRGILCVGGAGSGKSVSVLRQLMFSGVQRGFCGLIYDFKAPTLTNELRNYLNAQKGLKMPLYEISFHDLEHSHRVNPLHPDYIRSASHAREYATALINNLLPESLEKKDFWTRSCTDILAAVMFYLAKEQPQLCTLPHVVALILTDEHRIISLLSQNLQSLGMVKSLETAVRNNSSEQLSGVISTLQSAISVLNTPEIFWVLSGNDFSLRLNDPAAPVWLSLGNCAELAETYSPVLSLIATVALKQMNQQGGHHSVVLLDEAPTLYIPKLDGIPATARSNKISLAFFAQDTSQIVNQYGQKNADVIMSLLNNQLFGRVGSQKTAEHISKLFGRYDKEFSSYSKNKGKTTAIMSRSKNTGTSTSQAIQERDRVRPQELLNLDVGQFVGFTVEGINKEFRTIFALIESHPEAAPLLYPEAAPEAVFNLIHGQIGLIAGEPTTAHGG